VELKPGDFVLEAHGQPALTATFAYAAHPR
jgi:hypothetical protein